jgi:hypothetical protein
MPDRPNSGSDGPCQNRTGSGRLQGICLRSTDIDRCWGGGVEIRGPAKALMMAVSGRPALLHLLEGPGLPRLQRRMTPP